MSEVTPQQPSHSVLVVDDDEGIRYVMTRILTRAGYTVTTVVNGREAIQQIQSHRFDAIVLDLMMPIMNGYEVIAYIKQHQSGRQRVIVVSAAGTRAFEKVDMSVVAAIVPKPFELDVVVATVNDCIQAFELSE